MATEYSERPLLGHAEVQAPALYPRVLAGTAKSRIPEQHPNAYGCCRCLQGMLWRHHRKKHRKRWVPGQGHLRRPQRSDERCAAVCAQSF